MAIESTQSPQVILLGSDGPLLDSIREAVQEDIESIVVTDSIEESLDSHPSENLQCIVHVIDDAPNSVDDLPLHGASRHPIPEVLIVPNMDHQIVPSAMEVGVTEIIPIEPLEEPASIISTRISHQVGRHREQRRTGALGYKVRQLIDHIDDVVWIFSRDWDELLYVNDAYEDIWGQPVEDAYEHPRDFLTGVHPTDRPKVRRAMERASAGNEIELEYRVNREEDYNRWVWVKGYPIRDESGTVIAVSGVARDVSDRKLQEQRYQRERDRFLSLFEHFPEPTIAYRLEDGASRIQAVNEAFTSIFGYQPAEVIGQHIDDLITPSSRQQGASVIDERIRNGDRIDTEVVRETVSGQRHFRLQTITLDQDDQFDGFAVYADINEQKQRERILNELHGTSRELSTATDHEEVATIACEAATAIFDRAGAGIWMLDDEEQQARATYLTAELREVLDGPPELEVPSTFLTRVIEDETITFDGDGIPDWWPSTFEPVEYGTCLALGEDGFMLIWDAQADEDAHQHRPFLRILAANTHAALARADREETLRRQQRKLQHQNKRLEEFTSVVSHDLRTPLAVASGSLEQLKDEHPDLDPVAVENALDRMDSIISKTLTLARSGQMTGETEPVDLSTFSKRHIHAIHANDVHLEVDDGLPTVQADPDRLRHVFENLYRNAIEHGPDDVEITVEAVEEGFAVSDNGPGIPPDQRDRVFETGFSTASDGTGFGLAIVRQIAEAHDWSVSIAESPAGGARFVFTDIDIVSSEE